MLQFHTTQKLRNDKQRQGIKGSKNHIHASAMIRKYAFIRFYFHHILLWDLDLETFAANP